MEVPGPCAVCGDHTLLETCTLCGVNACAAHYDSASACCARCLRATGVGPSRLPSLPDDAGGRFT